MGNVDATDDSPVTKKSSSKSHDRSKKSPRVIEESLPLSEDGSAESSKTKKVKGSSKSAMKSLHSSTAQTEIPSPILKTRNNEEDSPAKSMKGPAAKSKRSLKSKKSKGLKSALAKGLKSSDESQGISRSNQTIKKLNKSSVSPTRVEQGEGASLKPQKAINQAEIDRKEKKLASEMKRYEKWKFYKAGMRISFLTHRYVK